MTKSEFSAYVVEKNASGQVEASVKRLKWDELPRARPGDVLIKAHWSSLNYKDALAATGHPGVVRNFPHVPGIDVSGEVVDLAPGERTTPSLSKGDEVFATGYDLGAGKWGGWSQYVWVPREWIVKPLAEPSPGTQRLSLREAMVLGTAGFTAGLCVDALVHHGVDPAAGAVVVTGATGGVGCLAIMLLARLGYRVVAVTGKAAWHDRLRQWGASEILTREAVIDSSGKPLLPARWAGVVDTVGGPTLATLIRQTQNNGCVAACGLVGGTDLPLSVYPFILRGVTLAGIDSAWCSPHKRHTIWSKLANEWRIKQLEDIVTEITLAQVGQCVPRILAGEIAGRTLVKVA